MRVAASLTPRMPCRGGPLPVNAWETRFFSDPEKGQNRPPNAVLVGPGGHVWVRIFAELLTEPVRAPKTPFLTPFTSKNRFEDRQSFLQFALSILRGTSCAHTDPPGHQTALPSPGIGKVGLATFGAKSCQAQLGNFWCQKLPSRLGKKVAKPSWGLKKGKTIVNFAHWISPKAPEGAGPGNFWRQKLPGRGGKKVARALCLATEGT